MDDRLTLDEQQRLLTAAQSRRHGNGKTYRHAVRDELLLWLMLNGGLTSIEASWLRCADVHVPYTELEFELPLTGGRRTAPMLKVLPWVFVMHVQGRAAKSGMPGTYVFGLSDERIRNVVPMYGELARIARPVTPRLLRRTYAFDLFMRTRNIPALARALGISDRSATHYLATEMVGEASQAAS